MPEREKDRFQQSGDEAAAQMREPSDDSHSSQASIGLAVTREQINDVYAAGTSDGMMQLENEQIHIPHRTSRVENPESNSKGELPESNF